MDHIVLKPDLWVVGGGEMGLTHWLDCHIYLLQTNAGTVLIDAGGGIDTSRLIRNIKRLPGELAGKLRFLWLTHCHGDHAGGVHVLCNEFPGLEVITSPHEATMLERGTDNELGLTQARYAGTYPEDFTVTRCKVHSRTAHGQQWQLGRHVMTSWITPGHTAGSVCFDVDGPHGRYLFSGDTVFRGGLIQLLNTPGSEISAYRETAFNILSRLHPDCLFPGHGMWVVEEGWKHLQKCIHYFKKSGPPPMPAYVEKVW